MKKFVWTTGCLPRRYNQFVPHQKKKNSDCFSTMLPFLYFFVISANLVIKNI